MSCPEELDLNTAEARMTYNLSSPWQAAPVMSLHAGPLQYVSGTLWYVVRVPSEAFNYVFTWTENETLWQTSHVPEPSSGYLDLLGLSSSGSIDHQAVEERCSFDLIAPCWHNISVNTETLLLLWV